MHERRLEAANGGAPQRHARQRLSATTQVMRFGGALLLTAAASSFMLQHWQHGSSATRYAYLLAHTLLLALSGVVCGLRVRESRAARTFFAIVLASVPVHFAVLGGMLRSVLPLDAARGAQRPVADAQRPRSRSACSRSAWSCSRRSCGSSLLALARPCARELLQATLAMNACLLLPWRAPSLIAVLCGAMCGAAAVVRRARVARRRLRRAHAGRALRTRAARGADRDRRRARRAVLRSALFAYGAFAACAGLALFFAAPARVVATTRGAALQPLGRAARDVRHGLHVVCDPMRTRSRPA